MRMKRPKILWHVPLDAKYDEKDGYWVYIPKWIVRAYRLLDKWEHPRINLNARVVLRIADKGEAPVKYYRRYHYRQAHKYFAENWSNKQNRERKAAVRKKIKAGEKR